MSLGKLLATGRSLAGGPSVGRYNVSECNRLPKFGSAKNPFAQPTAKPLPEPGVPEVTVPALAVAPTAVENEPAAGAAAPFAAISLKKTQRIPHLAKPTLPERIQNARVALLTLGKQAFALAMVWAEKAWMLARSLFSRVKRVRRKEPASVIPRFGKPAIQGEFTLDNVKVVRNDLEESDLEIVTAQTNTSTQVAPTAAVSAPKRGPVPPALKKLTNHMLGVKLS